MAKTSAKPKIDQPDVEIVADGEIIPPGHPGSGVDWLALRRDFETTEMSVRMLAKQYGLKSDNAVRKRILAEKWERDIPAITERLVLQGVALTELPELPAHQKESARARQELSKKKSKSKGKSGCAPNDAPRTGESGGAHQRTRTKGAEPTDSPIVRAMAGDRPEHREELDLRTAHGMADLHSRAIAQQLDGATRARHLGEAILETLLKVLTAEAGSQELGEARARLLLVSADKETLSNLAKSAITLLEGSAIIQRRALGMDRAKGPGASDPLNTPGGRDAMQVMRRLPPDLLMKMRSVAQEISRLPSAAIEPQGDQE